MYIADSLPSSEISRAVFIGMNWEKHAGTFRGRRDFKVQRDFEEIPYSGKFSRGPFLAVFVDDRLPTKIKPAK